jgi:hypothetical protein
MRDSLPKLEDLAGAMFEHRASALDFLRQNFRESGTISITWRPQGISKA